MLNTVDLKATISKAKYKSENDALAERLGQLQRELLAADISSVIVFEGWDMAGKGAVLSELVHDLDPRWFFVHVPREPEMGTEFYPPMHFFWNHMPEFGEMAIYEKSWYAPILEERVHGPARLDQEAPIARTLNFERQLSDDGVIVTKFFLHISKKEQSRRLTELKADSAYSWRVTNIERERHRLYDDYHEETSAVLEATHCDAAPWYVLPSTDLRYAQQQIKKILIRTFEARLAEHKKGKKEKAPKVSLGKEKPLSTVEPNQKIQGKVYKKRLAELQEEARRLQYRCYEQRVPVLMVYEGQDAGGKGGNIRRVVREMDPRGYDVVPVAAPRGAEKNHHYLWRFWRDIPKAGHIAIFDRSWYGRVLVERLEDFAQKHEWQRAFQEINEFEAELHEAGAVILKFWVHIDADEQLARFKARESDPLKSWKMTDEDWRNREKWDAYQEAVNDMIHLTGTAHAPWTIVEGNNKRFARIKTLETIVAQLRERLDL